MRHAVGLIAGDRMGPEVADNHPIGKGVRLLWDR